MKLNELELCEEEKLSQTQSRGGRMMKINAITGAIVDAAYHLHSRTGPGLLVIDETPALSGSARE